MQALEVMAMNASPDDFLLFFFSGHGMIADDDISLVVDGYGNLIQGHLIRQWAHDTQDWCDYVTVIIDACFAEGVFTNFFNRVDLWSDPWVVVFSSILSHQPSFLFWEYLVDGTIVWLSVYTYFFCYTIIDFNHRIFTNQQLADSVFPHVASFYWPDEQFPTYDSPLGFMHLSFGRL
ncbi:hypothetical protein TSUD_307760 [Trifolium subterraneum]|nr:hypothetical protein TSUD_307760 [Trifolium subterraneum]